MDNMWIEYLCINFILGIEFMILYMLGKYYIIVIFLVLCLFLRLSFVKLFRMV